LSVHDVTDQNDDWLHDELNEATWELTTLTIIGISGELLLGWVEIVITPELLHKLQDVELELLGIDTSEAGECESPTEKGGTKSDSTVGWVDLLGFTHIIALVG